MKTSTLWLWVFFACLGCLPSKEALDETAADIRVLSLQARDTRGGQWPLDAVPRALHLELELKSQPAQPDKRMWLVNGSLDDLLAADLLDPPLRKGSQARLIATRTVPSERGVTVSTRAPLVPGQRYTMVVLEAPEQLWSQEVRVSPNPSAGAAFVEALPADQTRGVPRNLQSILLRFDGYLEADHEVLLRAGEDVLSTQSEISNCSTFGLAAGDCITVRPTGTLPAHAAMTLVVQKLRDGTGASLDALTFQFETSAALDTEAPTILELTCALDERALDEGGCVLEQDRALTLRLSVNEPTLATLTTAQKTQAALSFGPDLELALNDLAPQRVLPSTLSLTDLAGNTRTVPLGLATQDVLPSLSIDEVRCDPLGPEPAQEIIELLNFGREPIQITGFSLSSDALKPGVRIIDELSVLPGERVLAVGPAFDARDTNDGVLAPGVRLAHTDKALSLNNQGSVIVLRDKQNHRLSAAPRLKPETAGACVARITDDPRSGAGASFARDPNQSCTPGSETRWP